MPGKGEKERRHRFFISDRPAADEWAGLADRVWVGVTGHRHLGDGDAAELGRRIDQVLADIRYRVQAAGLAPVRFGVVSALAEGADRIVAEAVLRTAESVLHAVLPLPADEYRKDFASARSRAEFDQLLGRAAAVVAWPSPDDRDAAYAQAGQRVVDSCDVLIAVWDGQPTRGRGGTAKVIYRAGQHHPPRPIYLIQTPLAELQTFNQTIVQPYLDWLASHYVREDTASRCCRAWLLRAGNAVFLSAAVAVAAAATAAIFLHDRIDPVILEAVLMLALLIVVRLARSRKLHQRWLDHRSLAELCRTTLFLAVAGSRGRVRRPLEPLRQFLLAWIRDQSSYYQALRAQQRCRDQWTLKLIYLLFAATLLAAVLHALTHGLVPVQWRPALAYCSIVLPAVGGAVRGIRAQRDYQRTADRADQTDADLHQLEQQLIDAADLPAVQAVAAQVADRLGQENRDWYGNMLFHNVELHI